MDWMKWKAGIDKAVADVYIQIIKEPLSYFSKADIQQSLVEGLRKIEPLKKAYPTSVHKGKKSKGRYKTSLALRCIATREHRKQKVLCATELA
jgi:hypothetical protein